MAEAKKVVAVLGGYRVAPVSEEYKVAEDLGRRIAEAGWTLLAGLVVIAVFAPLSVRSYRRHM